MNPVNPDSCRCAALPMESAFPAPSKIAPEDIAFRIGKAVLIRVKTLI